MALFDWNAKFSVGIKSIDDQHMKLVEYINQLHAGMMAGKGNEVMGPILNGLVDYTQKHFKFEEDLFAKHGYAESAAHKAEHDKLVATVSNFHKKFKEGGATISTELMNTLKSWLTGHILGVDKKYSAYLIEKGVK